ncbi:MAG: hypothetical protein KDD40_09090 [Bdellovibrionales bacterium]|nr:hypothetical protein [Bdellovibrionales bacterium]
MKNLKRVIGVLTIIFFQQVCSAQIDVRQGSYIDNFLDFVIVNSANDIRLQRTYTSRSVDKGWFGWGWCSNLEVHLNIHSQSSLDYIDCQLEVSFQLHKNGQWFSADYKEMSLKKEGLNYFVTHMNGTVYVFNNRGKLQKIIDRANRRLSLSYYKSLLQGNENIQFENQQGFKVHLQFNSEQLIHKVKIMAPKGLAIYRYKEMLRPKNWTFSYSYTEGSLTEVKAETKLIYHYTYTKDKNLNKIDNEFGQQKTIFYDQQNDWVTRIVDFDGCIETMKYWFHPQIPQNNYRSQYLKSCDGKVIKAGNFEFTYEMHPLMGRYLKSLQMSNGKKIKSIEFNPLTGRPVERNVSNHF